MVIVAKLTDNFKSENDTWSQRSHESLPKMLCDGRVMQRVMLKAIGEHPSGTTEDGGMSRKPKEDNHSYMHGGFGHSNWFTMREGRRATA